VISKETGEVVLRSSREDYGDVTSPVLFTALCYAEAYVEHYGPELLEVVEVALAWVVPVRS
jgi:hypothetical protein